MILVIVLLLLNPVTSNLERESSCSQNIQCSGKESPLCVKVKRRDQNTVHVVVPNQCELQRVQCAEGVQTTVVSMKNCHYPNKRLDTKTIKNNRPKRQTESDFLPDRVITDDYRRELGFMVDISLKGIERWDALRTTVTQIAEEAAHYYNVTFFAFSTTGRGTEIYSSKKFENVAEFLKRFLYYTYTWLNVTEGKPDYCQGLLLTSIHQYLELVDSENVNIGNSYLYVFTHNLAKDYDLVRTWPTKRNTKITIILMPDCLDRHVRDKPELQAYYDLTAKTGGQTFRMRHDSDVTKVSEFIRYTALAFEPKLLLSEIKPHGSFIEIGVEKSVAYVVVSVCGSNVDFAIVDHRGNKIKPQFLINSAHSKVYRFVALPPQSYEVRLDQSIYQYGKWNVTVNVVTSQVDFTFQYRVSKKRKWKNSRRDLDDDASRKPKYLIIYVTDKRDLVDVNKIKFIELEDGVEDVFASYTLVQIAEHVYATEYKITMPTHNFFMVAAGTLKGTTKEVESREVLYKPATSENQEDTSSSEETEEDPDHKRSTMSSTMRTTRPTFRTSTCSMWPESLLLAGKGKNNTRENQKLLRWKQFRGSCPAQCPVRDVMVCARCQHGVQTTFMSDCHMRMFQCKYPGDKLILVARRPCLDSSPFLGDMPRPAENMDEPNDEDPVMSHIFDKQK